MTTTQVSAAPEGEYASTRQPRGFALFQERSGEIQQIGRGLYSVPSCSDPRRDYEVYYTTDAVRCSCNDFQYRREICKHIHAVSLYAARRRKAIEIAFAPVLADEDDAARAVSEVQTQWRKEA